MKNLNFISIFALTIAASFISGLSCSSRVDEESFATDSPPLVFSESGVLVFTNWRELYDMSILLSNMPRHSRLEWEKSNQVITRATIFENIMDAEEAIETEYYRPYLSSGLSEVEIMTLGIPKPSHSHEYLDAREKSVILVVEDSDTASTYHLNSPLPYSCVINSEGFVKVGDTIALLLKNEIKFWVDGDMEDRNLLHRASQSLPSHGIYVHNLDGANRSNWWGSASYFYRWVYESGSTPDRRAAYELRGLTIQHSNTHMYLENWFELHAQRKSFGKWAARNTYRPNFHIAGYWTHMFGKSDLHGCTQVSSVFTNWSNPNNSHNTGYLSPVLNAVVPADNFAYQWETIYPDGNFHLNTGFCEILRVTSMDVNVHAVGDGGGTLDLGAHIF